MRPKESHKARRPPEYITSLLENHWNVGFGAGYVSPDPEAEDTKRRENLPSWEHIEQQETLFLVYGHGIVARFVGH